MAVTAGCALSGICLSVWSSPEAVGEDFDEAFVAGESGVFEPVKFMYFLLSRNMNRTDAPKDATKISKIPASKIPWYSSGTMDRLRQVW